MGIKRAAKRILFGIEESTIPQIGGFGDTDDHKFRQLDGNKRKKRDLDSISQELMIQNSYYLYDSNPFAHRIIDMISEFIIGEGVVLEAEHPDVQKMIDLFWNDPVNNMELNQENFIRDLSLTGEQFYPVQRNISNGLVRLGYIDPENVSSVIYSSDNALVPDKIVMKKKDNSEDSDVYIIVRPSIHPQFPGKLTIITNDFVQDSTLPIFGDRITIGDSNKFIVKGSILYFSINKPLSGTRGRGDLLPLIDWLDAYDQFMWARLERIKHMGDYTWKAKFTGKTEAELKKLAETWPTPKSNSVWLHNDNMDLEAVTPNLQAEDASAEASMFKNQILGGSSFPPQWFAESVAGASNAQEMNEPAFKHLLSRQRLFIHMLQLMFSLQNDQAVIAHRIRPNISKVINIDIPDLSVRDNQRITASLNRLVSSMEIAVDAELLDKDEATEVIRKSIKTLGFTLGQRKKLNKNINESDVDKS